MEPANQSRWGQGAASASTSLQKSQGLPQLSDSPDILSMSSSCDPHLTNGSRQNHIRLDIWQRHSGSDCTWYIQCGRLGERWAVSVLWYPVMPRARSAEHTAATVRFEYQHPQTSRWCLYRIHSSPAGHVSHIPRAANASAPSQCIHSNSLRSLVRQSFSLLDHLQIWSTKGQGLSIFRLYRSCEFFSLVLLL